MNQLQRHLFFHQRVEDLDARAVCKHLEEVCQLVEHLLAGKHLRCDLAGVYRAAAALGALVVAHVILQTSEHMLIC